MKNYKFLVLFAFALLLASPAYALQCKAGNFEASDECWTNVKVASGETIAVIPGTILQYDFLSVDSSEDKGAFQVRVARELTDGYKLAGVAQSRIASGDYGKILVRGKGLVRVAEATASGDRLFVSATDGALEDTNNTTVASTASRDKAAAFSLESSSGAATIDAYVVIL